MSDLLLLVRKEIQIFSLFYRKLGNLQFFFTYILSIARPSRNSLILLPHTLRFADPESISNKLNVLLHTTKNK
jgi:hypothetical protein